MKNPFRRNPHLETLQIGGIEVRLEYEKSAGKTYIEIRGTGSTTVKPPQNNLAALIDNALYDIKPNWAYGFPAKVSDSLLKTMPNTSKEDFAKVHTALLALQSALPDTAALDHAYKNYEATHTTAWREHEAGRDTARAQKAGQLADIAAKFFEDTKGLALSDDEKDALTRLLAEHLKDKERSGRL